MKKTTAVPTADISKGYIRLIIKLVIQVVAVAIDIKRALIFPGNISDIINQVTGLTIP